CARDPSHWYFDVW
nr:immunoglobulin heavy chain junction region [Mus musculus]